MDDLEQLLNNQVVDPWYDKFHNPVADSVSVGVFFAATDSVRVPVSDYTFISKIALRHSLAEWHDNMMK